MEESQVRGGGVLKGGRKGSHVNGVVGNTVKEKDNSQRRLGERCRRRGKGKERMVEELI